MSNRVIYPIVLSGAIFFQFCYGAFELETIYSYLYGRNYVKSPFLYSSHPTSIRLVHTNLYQIPGLTYSSLVAVLPIKQKRFDFSYMQLGNKLFQTSVYALSGYVPFGKRMYLATQFNFYQIAISNYGHTQSYGVSLKLLVQSSSFLWWSLESQNINRSKIGTGQEFLPQYLVAMIGYQPADIISCSAVMIHDLSGYESKRIFAFKTFIHPFNWLALYAGVIPSPAQMEIGISLDISKITVSYSMNYHHDLSSVSPTITISFNRDLHF